MPKHVSGQGRAPDIVETPERHILDRKHVFWHIDCPELRNR